uniref:Putative LOC100901472 [Metaseiulus occidentalis] n=2 Tax=Lepeophtheirus salmonis TaxID=72036 RepID=A0A0K2TPW6_LEPSM
MENQLKSKIKTKLKLKYTDLKKCTAKKGGIFDGLQMRKVMRYSNFIASINQAEKRVWNVFCNVMKNLLRNKRETNMKRFWKSYQ